MKDKSLECSKKEKNKNICSSYADIDLEGTENLMGLWAKRLDEGKIKKITSTEVEASRKSFSEWASFSDAGNRTPHHN